MASESDSLVAILADMLRSALTWEEKNAISSSQTDLWDLSDVFDPYTSPSRTAKDNHDTKERRQRIWESRGFHEANSMNPP